MELLGYFTTKPEQERTLHRNLQLAMMSLCHSLLAMENHIRISYFLVPSIGPWTRSLLYLIVRIKMHRRRKQGGTGGTCPPPPPHFVDWGHRGHAPTHVLFSQQPLAARLLCPPPPPPPPSQRHLPSPMRCSHSCILPGSIREKCLGYCLQC